MVTPLKLGAAVKLSPGGKLAGGGVTGVVGVVVGALGGVVEPEPVEVEPVEVDPLDELVLPLELEEGSEGVELTELVCEPLMLTAAEPPQPASKANEPAMRAPRKVIS